MDFQSRELQLDNDFTGGDDDLFIGGSEYIYTPPVTGGFEGGAVITSCLLSLFIVVLVLLTISLFTNKKKVYRVCGCKAKGKKICNCRLPHYTAYDATLVPPSYFDYNKKGRQYINWARS